MFASALLKRFGGAARVLAFRRYGSCNSPQCSNPKCPLKAKEGPCATRPPSGGCCGSVPPVITLCDLASGSSKHCPPERDPPEPCPGSKPPCPCPPQPPRCPPPPQPPCCPPPEPCPCPCPRPKPHCPCPPPPQQSPCCPRPPPPCPTPKPPCCPPRPAHPKPRDPPCCPSCGTPLHSAPSPPCPATDKSPGSLRGALPKVAPPFCKIKMTSDRRQPKPLSRSGSRSDLDRQYRPSPSANVNSYRPNRFEPPALEKSHHDAGVRSDKTISKEQTRTPAAKSVSFEKPTSTKRALPHAPVHFTPQQRSIHRNLRGPYVSSIGCTSCEPRTPSLIRHSSPSFSDYYTELGRARLSQRFKWVRRYSSSTREESPSLVKSRTSCPIKEKVPCSKNEHPSCCVSAEGSSCSKAKSDPLPCPPKKCTREPSSYQSPCHLKPQPPCDRPSRLFTYEPECDLLCELETQVFRKPNSCCEWQEIDSYYSCYQNKEYHAYKMTTYYDLNRYMQVYRQPQPNCKKTPRKTAY